MLILYYLAKLFRRETRGMFWLLVKISSVRLPDSHSARLGHPPWRKRWLSNFLSCFEHEHGGRILPRNCDQLPKTESDLRPGRKSDQIRDRAWQRYRVRGHIRALSVCRLPDNQAWARKVVGVCSSGWSWLWRTLLIFCSSLSYITVCSSSLVFDSWRSRPSCEVHRSLSLLVWGWKILTTSRFPWARRTKSSCCNSITISIVKWACPDNDGWS